MDVGPGPAHHGLGPGPWAWAFGPVGLSQRVDHSTNHETVSVKIRSDIAVHFVGRRSLVSDLLQLLHLTRVARLLAARIWLFPSEKYGLGFCCETWAQAQTQGPEIF